MDLHEANVLGSLLQKDLNLAAALFLSARISLTRQPQEFVFPLTSASILTSLMVPQLHWHLILVEEPLLSSMTVSLPNLALRVILLYPCPTTILFFAFSAPVSLP